MKIQERLLIKDKATDDVWYLCNISDISNTDTSSITQYTTISGSKISDNFYVEPKKLTFSVSFSRYLPSCIYYIDGTTGRIRELMKSNADLELFKTTIRNWKDTGTRLDIITYEEKYSNMVINSITSQESSTNHGIWNPTIALEEVREAYVEYKRIKIDTSSPENASLTLEQELGVALASSEISDKYATAFFTENYGKSFIETVGEVVLTPEDIRNLEIYG